MAQFFTSIGVGCILFALWRSESIAAALAMLWFAIGGFWFFTGSAATGDMMYWSGFATLFGGVIVSSLLLYLQRPKEEDEAEAALDELDAELSDEEKAIRKEKFKTIRMNKRIKRANKNLPQGERYES